jgi:hypothetical protein
MNDLFNTKTRLHRKNEQIIQQVKHTIGENVRLIFKRDLKNLKINGDEVFTHLQSFYHLSFLLYLRRISFNRYSIHGISLIRSQPTIQMMIVIL